MEHRLFVIALITVSGCVLTSGESLTSLDLNRESAADLKNQGNDPEDNTIEGKSANRNPKFGFAIPFPNIPGMGSEGNSTPGPTPDTHIFGGLTGDLTGTSTSLGTTAILIKGGILSGLMALKAAIIPPIFVGALILFLIAGAAFFTCSLVNCGRFVSDFTGGSSPNFPPFNPFNRNSIDDYEQQQRPVFQALDDSYKKYK